MLHAVVAAAFQDMQEAYDIGADVHMWVLRGVAHAGLRGQVHHALRPVCGENALYRGAVGQVCMHVGVVGMVGEARQPRLLQVHIVVVRQIVDAGDLVAAREQAHGEVGANEPGGTGD